MIRLFAKKSIFAAAITLSMIGCEKEQAPAARQQPTIQIVAHKVALRTDVITIEAVGTARARAFAEIYPDTGGEVTSVGFTAGTKVDKGATLLQLDAREERLGVERAKVAVKDAEQLLNRYQKLESPGAISISQIDEARTALDGATIDLELAQVALAERSVNAPFKGFVGLTDIDAGARITTQTIITRLDDREVLFVDFAAPEQVFGRIAIGTTIPMSPFADPTRRYDAVVRTVDSRIDATSRSFTVRAEIDNRRDDLRPGMSFRVGFELPGQAYPAVPEAAIVWGGDGAFVWQVRDGKAARVSVTIVSRQEGQVLVRAPISEGALIVAEGVQKVRDGTAVTDPAMTQPATALPAGNALTQ